ncbi:MAG: class I SAM-dependent methyltransferase [Sedimentisphaerales bacterium]|nr:class I SAM-dependent methyltransferase [Sedimentisphaerales bacterium]
MDEPKFDPYEYYASYPVKVIGRPGYPARAAFKGALLWKLYGRELRRRLGDINTYADIGGCFGFAANAMAFHVARCQGRPPQTMVFEIASDFVNIGKRLFPDVHFVEAEFGSWTGAPKVFDLITLFDVLEHLVDPEALLRCVAARCRYVLLKTPMETTGRWRGSRPRAEGGEAHPDGHIQFFSPGSYEALLDRCGLDLVRSRLVPTIVPLGARLALVPESLDAPSPGPTAAVKRYVRAGVRTVHLGMPAWLFRIVRGVVGGGTHLCLCRSRRVGPGASDSSSVKP